MWSLTRVSKTEVGQVLKPGVTQIDLGIETQRWVWVPVLGLGSKPLKGWQERGCAECLRLCTRKIKSLCLERGQIPPPHSITDEVLSCSLQELPQAHELGRM